MTVIIAGHFEQQDEAKAALAALLRAGAPETQLTSFYVNPPGQHDMFPIGGDRDESPGAEDSDKGSIAGLAAGGLIGGAAGTAAGPLGAVTGALVGAHIGSLVGTLTSTDEEKDTPPLRKAGMLVAVTVTSEEEEEKAIATFRGLGAQCVERAEGQIVDGDWTDFNPLSSPIFV
ncbi:hypothetical protein ACFQPC_08930 [Herminiimonas glaciei]|uniref:Glycine zipper domain-containing protein n=1 Tax=Herminiimonas glaciei TaxID=523788 RepID=A0ABW2IAR2_9BURK